MRAVKIAVCVGLLTTLVFCEKHFNPPPAAPAATYPLHETHSDEKVTIAVEPCDTAEARKIFKVDYQKYGLFPYRLIITNDSDSTLMLDEMEIQYITARRDKFRPATDDDIYRRLVRPSKVEKGDPGIKLPIPIGKKRPISSDTIEEYHTAQFQKVPVTAHSTNSGYLFFDMLEEDGPAAGAHLDLSGIKAGTKELFYFDIPLDKSSDARTNPK